MPRKTSASDIAYGPAPTIPGATAAQVTQIVRSQVHREICNQFWKHKDRRYFVRSDVLAPICPSLAGTPLIVFAYCAKREREDASWDFMEKCGSCPYAASMGRLGVEMFAVGANTVELTFYRESTGEDIASLGYRTKSRSALYSAVLLGSRGDSIKVRSELDLYEWGLVEVPR